MKNRSINLMISTLVLFAIFSVILLVFLWDAHERFPKEITVAEDGVVETLSFRDLQLSPTESREYTVNLICAASGSYRVSLEYDETKDGGMKPFVNVAILCDGVTEFEGNLGELLDGGVITSFMSELHATDPVEITFRYVMPREVGNEAQGTYADFDIHLAIKKAD